MSYRTLLVYVDRGVESDERVSLAIDLACRLDARLIGLSGSTPEADLSGADAGGAMVGEALTLLRDCAHSDVKAAQTRFSELTDFCADRTEWRGEVGYPADLIARAARAADLVIVGRNHERSPYHNLNPADALMGIGRPVLVLPPGPPAAPDGGVAVIAWKDTPQAQRAVIAALPLLKRADAVEVLCLCSEEGKPEAKIGAADVVEHLRRHDVSASAVVRVRALRFTAIQILEFAMAKSAHLVVAGGYGHARLREWALGGVTRSLIAQTPVCLLLTH